ncbi:MAG: carboxypeptidase-like regulatory domain-containing protein [Bacteroidales bacterium]
MKMNSRPILPAVLLLLAGATVRLAGQSPFDSEWEAQARLIRERVTLETDRSLYVVEETVRFQGRSRVEGPVGEGDWSTVLYTELISSDGESVARTKTLGERGRFDGSLMLPGNLATGNYLLRSYTRWMRNRGPEDFACLPLTVVNPFRADLSGEADAASGIRVQEREPLAPGLVRGVQTGTGEAQGMLLPDPDPWPGYRPGVGSQCERGGMGIGGHTSGRMQSRRKGDAFRPDFLPDRHGPSLSGRVTSEGDAAVPYARLHFALMGERTGYFSTMADEEGRFVIPTPGESGALVPFVAPEQTEDRIANVRIGPGLRLPGLFLPPPSVWIPSRRSWSEARWPSGCSWPGSTRPGTCPSTVRSTAFLLRQWMFTGSIWMTMSFFPPWKRCSSTWCTRWTSCTAGAAPA